MPDLSLYISPVNIHPEHPVLPISYPAFFSSWLAKKIGLFGTLGLMEDTWGRNEKALNDFAFLEQAYLTHRERERMFNEVLKRTREGLCVCVFDASDRIQHMFWRYMEQDHPSPVEDRKVFGDTIPEMYKEMDRLVGRIKGQLNPNDSLIVLSDHGFSSFRRCVNLNTWLLREGYLHLKDGAEKLNATESGIIGRDYLQDVDWTKTRAFALGLSGLYLNKKGREADGIVSEHEAEALKLEIITKLQALRDPQDDQMAVRKAYDSLKNYRGVYTSEAPDIIVGWEKGYRVSWESITGTLESEVFSDNLKAWSGDHHVDPKLVPGVLFASFKLNSDTPHITDLAPTVLHMFGLKPPAYMEGKRLI